MDPKQVNGSLDSKAIASALVDQAWGHKQQYLKQLLGANSYRLPLGLKICYRYRLTTVGFYSYLLPLTAETDIYYRLPHPPGTPDPSPSPNPRPQSPPSPKYVPNPPQSTIPVHKPNSAEEL